jgi:hypothetical protein
MLTHMENDVKGGLESWLVPAWKGAATVGWLKLRACND